MSQACAFQIQIAAFAGKHSAESAQLKAMVAALKNKGAKKLKQKAQLGKPSRKGGN